MSKPNVLDLTKRSGFYCFSCLQLYMNIYYADENPVGVVCPKCKFWAAVVSLPQLDQSPEARGQPNKKICPSKIM